MIELNH